MKPCPDCNLKLKPIHVVDKSGGRSWVGFSYTTKVPPKSGWARKDRIKNAEGTIKGFMCRQCNLVRFYAVPGQGAERI